mmetsp:Transcript_27426/g.64282  ORF Transcript_27426/g.64282 Transcript_27426/m.64282 type:complete len:93 (-) Transcript_27426:95-373(-)
MKCDTMKWNWMECACCDGKNSRLGTGENNDACDDDDRHEDFPSELTRRKLQGILPTHYLPTSQDILLRSFYCTQHNSIVLSDRETSSELNSE